MKSFQEMLNKMIEDYEQRHPGETAEPIDPEKAPPRCPICRDYETPNGEPCPRCQKELDQGYQVRSLAGRCANGAELDHGRLFHALPFDSYIAFCGYKPGRRSAGWSDYGHGQDVTCARCQKKLERLKKMNELLTIKKCLALPETKERSRQPHRWTLNNAINKGHLAAIKPGQDFLIKKQDYLDWLEGFPHNPGPQPKK